MKLKAIILKSCQSIVVILIMFQCKSANNVDKKIPLNFNQVYFQKWVGGIQESGYGLNIFIPINKNDTSSIVLDSVYFRGKSSKLEFMPTNNTYVGRFKTLPQQDIILSNDVREEYKNKLPKQQNDTNFSINDNECVVSYLLENKMHFFKIKNIIEKEPLYYPQSPPNN